MCIGIRPVVLQSSGIGQLLASATTSGSKDGNHKTKESMKVMIEPFDAPGVSRKRSLLETYSVSTSCASGTSAGPLEEGFNEHGSDRKNLGNKRSKPMYKTNERSVRFEEKKTFFSSQHSFSDEERKELWYGLEDCAQLNATSNKTIRDFRDGHLDSIRKILCVASQCSHSPPPMAYLDTVRLRLPDDTCGLEIGMLPLQVRQRRQRHVKRVVVEIQQLVSANKLPSCCGGKNNGAALSKEEAMAWHARRSSQASCLFSQLIAREVAEDVAGFAVE